MSHIKQLERLWQSIHSVQHMEHSMPAAFHDIIIYSATRAKSISSSWVCDRYRVQNRVSSLVICDATEEFLQLIHLLERYSNTLELIHA